MGSIETHNTYRKIIKQEEEHIKEKISTNYPFFPDISFIEKPSGTLLNIVNTIAEAEYPRKVTKDALSFCGPHVPSDTTVIPHFLKNVKKKIVYVSLGTVFNKQPKLFVRIIDSIPPDQYKIVVSAGASFKYLNTKYRSTDIIIRKFVNQIVLLKAANIFITHGGKNSINEALKLGVPMILFPAGGEQEYNANLVEFLKAGINFSPMLKTFGKKEMVETIDKILNNGIIAEASSNLSKKHNIDGVEVAYTKIIEAYNFKFKRNN